MRDPRLEKLADNLVNFSTAIKPGDMLYLEIKGKDTLDLGKEIIAAATKAGANHFFFYNDASQVSKFLNAASAEQIINLGDLHLDIMKKANVYIGIRGDDNSFDLSNVGSDKMKIYKEEFVNKVHIKQRVENTRWVVLRYPNSSMCTLAESNQEDFEDFYFNVCNLDYAKLSKHMDPLKKLMEETDQVKITGPGTNLTFSIKNIPAIKCDGKLNIPDGEIYTAPVKESVNGIITYNAPALSDGIVYNNICFEFKDGKIIKATADSNEKKLNEKLDTDEGARYIGEFAIGVNPFITKAIKDTLFDEKIWGSIHLTPGNSYDNAPNGNKSAVHWDLVLIQTPEFGGGEIYFDDQLIRKDGEFVHQALTDFNKKAFL